MDESDFHLLEEDADDSADSADSSETDIESIPNPHANRSDFQAVVQGKKPDPKTDAARGSEIEMSQAEDDSELVISNNKSFSNKEPEDESPKSKSTSELPKSDSKLLKSKQKSDPISTNFGMLNSRPSNSQSFVQQIGPAMQTTRFGHVPPFKSSNFNFQLLTF